MADGITHTNKDVLFKVLSQNYKDKSFAVYGLNVPKVKRLLPSSYPVVSTEHRAENVFLLEDDSLLILEYESQALTANFLKYLRYIYSSVEKLRAEGLKITNVIVAVIYTGDISTAPAIYDIGALRLQVEQVFLTQFDSDKIYADIKTNLEAGVQISDDDIMRLIVLPLTQPEKDRKQQLIEDTVNLAKQIKDEVQQMFILAGILTATNKFIDRTYANQVKEWIKMTQVARLYEEEKIEAVNEAVNKTRAETRAETSLEERMELAKVMLIDGEDYLKIMKYTRLTRKDIEQIQQSLGA